MTVAEFLQWDADDASGRRWQLIDGEPVAMAPASQTHAFLVNEIGSLLRNHLLERGLPCRVGTEAGVVPRAGAEGNWRIPDLAVTCSRDLTAHMMQEPALLIEVLSPSNEAKTRANVWAFMSIPSVAEILVVRTDRIEAELLRRGGDLSWPPMPDFFRPPDALELASVGLTLPVAALYRTTSLAAA
jgi:Uma2 family endonuclease